MTTRTQKLRQLLAADTCHPMPCCWDGLSAKMIADAGFAFTFMSGFAVSVARLGQPDLGLISYGEMLDQGRNICAAVDIPVIGDGDTGYGNALNVERTVKGYMQAGFASIMIEDQVAPKRCGHTKGKLVVERQEALDRVRAAVNARNEADGDIMILARTDARALHGLDEAIWRAQQFAEIGADILFIEAPENQDEMATLTAEAPGIHMANLVEGGTTPILPTERLHELGYSFAAYPLTLMSAAMNAIQQSLNDFANGEHPSSRILKFSELRKISGFDDYYAAEQRYSSVGR
ncbi:MAG: isocitrate lyase/PEP mutase family protein [Rhizobiales bacterium]|nr:isocitrate lyase/PEP mutase family protein [Hyphomicrobiales bacterium]